MHRVIFNEFDRICRTRCVSGRALEVGCVAGPGSLLNLPALRSMSEKVGVGLDPPARCADHTILQANANDLSCFGDGTFDLVLSNAVLEHDPYFWKSLAECRRVLRSGGCLVLGVPGFRRSRLDRLGPALRKVPLVRRLHRHPFWNCLFHSTVTFMVHDFPGDYYRFSPQAVEEVFFADFDRVEVVSVMMPPRLVGSGIKR